MEMLPGITAIRVQTSLAECIVGHELVTKYRKQAETVGTQQAARNLRKQGWTLSQARMILLGVL